MTSEAGVLHMLHCFVVHACSLGACACHLHDPRHVHRQGSVEVASSVQALEGLQVDLSLYMLVDATCS